MEQLITALVFFVALWLDVSNVTDNKQLQTKCSQMVKIIKLIPAKLEVRRPAPCMC